MQTRFYIPHSALQSFVQCIMIVHAEIEKEAAICPYPPAPQNSLFFYIKDRIKVQKENEHSYLLQPRSVIVGPQITRVMININKSHKAVRVGFHPSGLYRLLGLPLSQMVDDSFDAEDLFGAEMREVNCRLQEASDFDSIKNVVEAFLLSKVKALKSELPFDKAMLQLMKEGGNLSMEATASKACLSLRQFERVSQERIGHSPKMFARLIRFSKAYRLRENYPQMNWTQIAHKCQYFDQMHFIKDFKQFAGVTPGIIEKDLHQAPVRLQASLRI